MKSTTVRFHILFFLAMFAFIGLLAGCRPDQGAAALPAIAEQGTATVPSSVVPTQTAAASPTPDPTETRSAPTATTTKVSTESPVPDSASFDGQEAYQRIAEQLDLGPRWPGSPGHTAVQQYIIENLEHLGWQVEGQVVPYQGERGLNIIGRANVGAGPVLILGAHYDTRRVADQTPGAVEQGLPVPGAVDGASGVAVLLELARVLDLEQVPHEVWLAFFDLEDNGSGGLPDWEWIVGSQYMADNLTVQPEAVVVVDMVGDADQQLYYDGNSDPALRAHLWQIATELGHGDYFIPEVKYTMIDDHLPFARRGIPAVDIIDFDYPYWHTVEDTLDKTSPDSLQRVGETVEVWLEQYLGSVPRNEP